MRKDPTEFRKRFAAYKNGKKPYDAGRPVLEDEYEAFLKTLPKNQRTIGAYNTRRYWELNGKPKNFAEAVGLGMYAVQEDDGMLGWHANSVLYNDKNDTFEFMKPNYHPTRWMEQVYGYDQDPEFLKDWKVLYNGPMLSDRYVRREKPGFKIIGGQLPKYGDGKGDIDFHDDVTKHIIRKEGVLAAPKDIGDGKITIGSGLTQQKYIDQYKRNGNKWSQKENYIAVKDTVRGFENSLRGILPEYDQYPAEMRKALIDIIYNIGEGGLKNSPKFLSAMKLHNWNEAKRLMDWDNSDPLFGNGARKRNAERAALFDAGLAHWSPAGPIEQMMEAKPVFVPPTFSVKTPTNTDYSIRTMTSSTVPLMLNSRNSGDSPLYGGNDYSVRIPTITEWIERQLMQPVIWPK